VLLYVSLDFTNPLMPGAVRFVHGAVEAVSADRARDADPSPRIALVAGPAPAAPAPPGPIARVRPRPAPSGRAQAVSPRRAIVPADPPAGAPDDH
jgi:hypothetical protein